MPDVEFSSQNYSASVEAEASCDTSKQDVKDRLRSLCGLLEEAIEEQIEGRSPPGPEERRPPQRPRKGDAGHSWGSGWTG